MDTRENIIREHTPGIEEHERLTATQDNYRQTETSDQQTVIIDPAVTGETDELDPTFHQQGLLNDPEDEETDEEDDDEFPSREDLEDEDYDLNHDPDDDQSLNIDDDDEF